MFSANLPEGSFFQVVNEKNALIFSNSGISQAYIGLPLRYNNDKRKKPLFSRGSRVCRHLFNSFSKLKSDEKNIKKRRLFH